MNCFPNNNEEISLIRFIAKYQYLNVSDAKYFFQSKKYYRNRISNLISKRFLKKISLNLVLDEVGIQYIKFFGYEYNLLNRNKKYLPRLLYISHLAAFYYQCDTLKFIPSFEIKDKTIFTITARRFIGIFEINGIDYLVYYITKEHDNRYINSIIYDIQKEKQYKNIIILAHPSQKISTNDFTFGLNKVLIINDTIENRDKLKYLNNIDWSIIIQKYYPKNVVLSSYNFCDYTDYENKYVSYFYFWDTEKVNRIKQFLVQNNNKNIDIICNAEMEDKLKQEFPNCNYVLINPDEYMKKEQNYYD